MNRELPKLLRTICDRYPSKRALAREIELTESRLGRAMRGQGALNALNCLRLAKVSGEPAPSVLRAAGHSEIAKLLEELYGQASPALRPAEATTLARLQSLRPSARRTVEALLALLSVKEPPGPKGHGRRPTS